MPYGELRCVHMVSQISKQRESKSKQGKEKDFVLFKGIISCRGKTHLTWCCKIKESTLLFIFYHILKVMGTWELWLCDKRGKLQTFLGAKSTNFVIEKKKLLVHSCLCYFLFANSISCISVSSHLKAFYSLCWICSCSFFLILMPSFCRVFVYVYDYFFKDYRNSNKKKSWGFLLI